MDTNIFAVNTIPSHYPVLSWLANSHLEKKGGYTIITSVSSMWRPSDLSFSRANFELAYDEFKEDWGEIDQDAMRSLSALRMGLHYQGAYVEARQKLRRAYEGYKIVFGLDNLYTKELRNILEDDMLGENHLKAGGLV